MDPRRTTAVVLAIFALLTATAIWTKVDSGGQNLAATGLAWGIQVAKPDRKEGARVAEVVVNDTFALMVALKTAQGGDTILLAPGSYSGLLIADLAIEGGVTITSADVTQQAVLTNFNVVGSSGVTFKNLEFLAEGPTSFAFQVNGSKNITFDHVRLHGSLDGDASNDVSGLQILKSSNISLTNSDLEQLARGIGVGSSSFVTIANNYIHDIRSDGMDFAEVDNVKIVDNVLRSFSPAPGDHPDAIQFWTKGTKAPSHDILISGNVIMKGDGTGSMQGIFMGDDAGNLPFEHLVVSNNLILGTGYNALRINGIKDLTLTDNVLVSTPGDTNRTSILIQNAQEVTATGNKAFIFGWDKIANLNQSGNTTLPAVTDNGKAALEQWYVTHPGTAVHLAPFVPGLTVPQPLPEPMADFTPQWLLNLDSFNDQLAMVGGTGGFGWGNFF